MGRAVVVGRPAAADRRRCPARALRRRDAVRRGDADRVRDALGQVRSNIPLQPDWAVGAGPAGRRAPDARLRGRRADPGPRAPDDRPAHPPRPDRRRGRRPELRGAAARRRPRARGAPGPGGRARPGARRKPAAPPRADGRELAVVVSLCATADEPQDPRRQAEAAARRRCGGASCPTRRPPATPSPWSRPGSPRIDHQLCVDTPPVRRVWCSQRTVDLGRCADEPAGVVAATGGGRRADVRRRRRRPGRAGAAGRLAAAAGRRGGEAGTWPGCWPTRGTADGQRDRGRAGCWRPGPSWWTYGLRREALALDAGAFLHAGPPIDWERASGPLRGALIGAMLLEGLADTPEQAERRRWRPATGCTGSRATTTARWARWPVSSARRCGCSSCATRCTAARRSARSTRGSARSCATAPTGPRWSSDCAGCPTVLGPLLQTAVRRAPAQARSTSSRSRRRCCRWATRGTTATGPGR